MKNILVDARSLADKNYSGVAWYTRHLLAAVARQDKANQYFLLAPGLARPQEVFPELDQANFIWLNPAGLNTLTNYFLIGPFNHPTLESFAPQKIDTVFLPNVHFVGWRRSSRKILTVHDLAWLKYPQFFQGQKHWYQRWWHQAVKAKRLIKQADQLIAVSQGTAQDLQDWLNVPAEKIKVIYSGVKLDGADNNLAAYNLPAKFILSLSSLEPRKNLVGLIEAYNLLRQTGADVADVALVIAGANAWQYQEIYRAAERSPYHAQIKFLGYVAEEKKAALYRAAGLFVFPSFYEGCGFPPLEAMSCGTPVVVGAAPALPEILGAAAILVDPFNVRQLAVAMAEALRPAVAEKLIAAGIKQVEKYSWDQAAGEYLRMF